MPQESCICTLVNASGPSRLFPFLALTFPSLVHLPSCSPRFFLLGRFVSVCLNHGFFSYFQVWISSFYIRSHPLSSFLSGSALLCFVLLPCSFRPAAVPGCALCVSFLIPSLLPISQWLSWIASFSCIGSWTEDLLLLGQFRSLGSSPVSFSTLRLCSPVACRPFILLFFFCFLFRLGRTFSHSWVSFLSFQAPGSSLPSRLCSSRLLPSCCSGFDGLVWFGFGLCAFNSLLGLCSSSSQSFGLFGCYLSISSFGYFSDTFSFGRCSFDETDHLWTLFFLCSPCGSYTFLLACFPLNDDCLRCRIMLFCFIPIIPSFILPGALCTSPLSGYPGSAFTFSGKLTHPHYTTNPGALILASMKSCCLVPVGGLIIGLAFVSLFHFFSPSIWNYVQSIFASGFTFLSVIDNWRFTHEHIHMGIPCILCILFPLCLPTPCLILSPCLHVLLRDVYEAVWTLKHFPSFDITSCTGLSICALVMLFCITSFEIFLCGQQGLTWQSVVPLSMTDGVCFPLLFLLLRILYGLSLLFRQAHKNLCCRRDGLFGLVYE